MAAGRMEMFRGLLLYVWMNGWMDGWMAGRPGGYCTKGGEAIPSDHCHALSRGKKACFRKWARQSARACMRQGKDKDGWMDGP
jgi:hypothetical protein